MAHILHPHSSETDEKSSKFRLTNDGNAILREIEVGHPAAKSMIELSRTQDEEVGDGTTSVIILGKSTLLSSFPRKVESVFTNLPFICSW